MSADAILLIQFHGGRNRPVRLLERPAPRALRVLLDAGLVRMAAELGLTAVSAWEYPLYGGTIVLALAKKGSRWGDQGRERHESCRPGDGRGGSRTHGSRLPERVAGKLGSCPGNLSRGCQVSIRNGGGLQRRISDISVDPVWPRHRPTPRRVADAAQGLHGRTMPGSRIIVTT